MIRARSHYSHHAFYQIYFTLSDLQICGDENEIIISRVRPFVNRICGKCEQFIEMLSSTPSPNEFIDSFQTSRTGILTSDLLGSKEDMIARATHPGIDFQLETAGNNFQAELFNVVKIGEHMDYGLDFRLWFRR